MIGRRKIALARELHDKALYADAHMNKADWMTAAAAIIGIVGIGFGLWWTDAVAALTIAADVTYDGWKAVRASVFDLMDARPVLVDDSANDPLPARVQSELERLPWVARAQVRLREEGHVFIGDALIEPKDTRGLLDKLDAAKRTVLGLDWRLHDIVLEPVASITPHLEDAPAGSVLAAGARSALGAGDERAVRAR